jgi:hypothetical protein
LFAPAFLEHHLETRVLSFNSHPVADIADDSSSNINPKTYELKQVITYSTYGDKALDMLQTVLFKNRENGRHTANTDL